MKVDYGALVQFSGRALRASARRPRPRLDPSLLTVMRLHSLAGARAESICSISGLKKRSSRTKRRWRCISVTLGNSFDATTIPSGQMHDNAESEKYRFGENILLFDVRKGS